MKPVVVLAALGLVAAACAESTTSVSPASGEETSTIDSAPPVADAATSGSDDPGSDPDAATSTDPVGDGPAATVVGEPLTTTPPATDVAATDPPSTTDAPGPAIEAFAGVATFYAGSGRAGQSWVPLGWWDGSAWNEAGFDEAGEFIEVPAPDVATVSATGLDFGDGPGSVIGGLSLGAQQEYCVGEETGPLIDLPSAPADTTASLGYDVVAVTADWPLQPRPVRQVGLDVPEYVTVGAELFSSVPDAADTGDVLQVVRVDLDGDSIEEVLVTFENITDDFGAAGDFTGVYARYPSADGSVVDELVVGYVPDAPVDFPTIGRFTIAAVADLNGDSSMEVLVRDMFWESAGMAVFALQDGRLVQVAGGGCGV